MPSAELIAIGTELLLGEIQDTNTRYLTRQLRNLGVDVFRATIIGDNPLRIADVIREALSRSEIVITTGGLGPTVDDPTRNAAALAFNVDVEFHPELWKEISSRFISRGIQPSENNKKQAFLPQGALPLSNPVGTAPAFYINRNPGLLICLPGVPSEMETIFQSSVIQLLQQIYGFNAIIRTRTLRTCCMGESSIDTLIADLETLSNPTVGLCAHPGIVDIRITAKANSEETANKMINAIDEEIRQRLPKVIFGVDNLTLPHAIDSLSKHNNLNIIIRLSGFSLTIYRELDSISSPLIKIIDQSYDIQATNILSSKNKPLVFTIELMSAREIPELILKFSKDMETITEQRSYNGPPSMTETWAFNTGMGFVWKQLFTITFGEQNGNS